MTDSILCDGCLDFQTIEFGTDSLQFVKLSDGSENYHLCDECAKLFWKWIKTIEEKEP